jgi:hypothetical protein
VTSGGKIIVVVVIKVVDVENDSVVIVELIRSVLTLVDTYVVVAIVPWALKKELYCDEQNARFTVLVVVVVVRGEVVEGVGVLELAELVVDKL